MTDDKRFYVPCPLTKNKSKTVPITTCYRCRQAEWDEDWATEKGNKKPHCSLRKEGMQEEK